MTSRLMKWLSIGALLVGLLAQGSTGYRIVLDLVVCVSALIVLSQAIRTQKYLWGTCFLSIAVLFNPLVPLELAGGISLWLDLACIAMFAVSLQVLKMKPTLSIEGIIRVPRLPESL